MNTESVRNYQERVVFDMVVAEAALRPLFANDDDLLADVACVALNSLPPRYIRHVVDMHFYMTNRERAQNDTAVRAAVEAAFDYIAKRLAAKSPAAQRG
jgi:hypothetical protein